MKTVLILGMMMVGQAAGACPDFSGKYLRDANVQVTIVQKGCEALTMTIKDEKLPAITVKFSSDPRGGDNTYSDYNMIFGDYLIYQMINNTPNELIMYSGVIEMLPGGNLMSHDSMRGFGAFSIGPSTSTDIFTKQ